MLATSVASWPPCMLAVEQKRPTGLPIRAPFIHSPPVWSQKLRIWEHMLPKRVGVPTMMAW